MSSQNDESLYKKSEEMATLYQILRFKNLSGELIQERYQVQERIGFGGTSDVYRAIDLQTTTKVALKRLIPSVKSRKNKLEQRFTREVSFLETVDNPYVVEIYDAFELDSCYYLIMEYIEGTDLDTLVKETHDTPQQLSILEIISIMTKIARGLESIHATGVIHRDIKPANIMVHRLADIVKILDLGLAHGMGESQIHELSGTITYMSPEQINFAHKMSPASDIFSLGATFYFLLAGEAPFSGEGVQCLVQICEKSPTDLREINKNIPPSLSKMVEKAMAKSPHERYANAGELACQLQCLRQELLANLSQICDYHNPLDLSETKQLTSTELYFLTQIAYLGSSDKKSRRHAIRRLGWLREPRALKPLVYLMKDPKISSQRNIVRLIIITLGKLGSMNCVEPIKQIFLSSPDGNIRKLCQKSLQKLLHPGYIAEVERVLDHYLLKISEFRHTSRIQLLRYRHTWFEQIKSFIRRRL